MKTKMMSVAAYVSANPTAFKAASLLFTAALALVFSASPGGAISLNGWASGGAGGS